MTRYFSAVRPFSYLIFAGVLDRYPNLKMVGAEVDGARVATRCNPLQTVQASMAL